ncbi:MAG: dienelactone hydrolase family protein [Candidatus Omnitrophica bacterium]|nr:dienelactone hydrolase family protein [Candidatus Omnitrophota bacterium]
MAKKSTEAFNPDMPIQTEGEMVTLTIKSGIPFQVYEALAKSPSHFSVLLVHEWWGLNDHMKATADQFALLGYNAIVVDLYGGQVTDNPDEAGILMKAVKPDEAQSKLEAALEYLAAKSQKTAMMGWCFGGGWALKASLARPDLVDATVIYYGELISDPDKLKHLRGPLLGIFAKRDGWITPKWVDTFKTALEKAGVRYEIYSYDADHAFANPSNKHFDKEAYKDAWSKTLEFLKDNLRGNQRIR